MAADAEILLWGRFATSALASRHGEVIAVFEKSLYVETRSGIACIGAELGGGPLNARCSAALTSIAVGDAVACRSGRISVGSARLATRGAIDWRPPEPRFDPRLDEIAAAEPGGGLSRLAQALARGEPFDPGDDPFLRKVSRAAAALVAADFDNAEPLLGLGPGLTPSGDDFIGGYLVALHALGRRHEAEAIAARLLPLAAQRTGRISAAHLAAAAKGEAAAVFHTALAGGDPHPLLVLGHSSGWDMLAGALTAFRTTR
jgi:hypothetical protein